jgi:phosphoglycolate phosphatase-like HAD superfamily hydrolase
MAKIKCIIFDLDGTIAVGWGFNTREILASQNPDFLIDKPEKLIRVLG